MYIKKILLKNYRNIKIIELNLEKGINIFYGDNAQGKTNLLESIYICATGRSHRTYKDKELISFDETQAYIKAYIQNEQSVDKIDIHLKKDGKKGIAINSLPIKKIGELLGYLNIVIFSPEDLNLIKLGPLERRRFVDMELCQLNQVYYHNLSEYHKILKQRNILLKKISLDNSLKDTIFIWDRQLVQYGNKIMEKREEFIKKINKISNDIHKNITNNKENLKIEYKKNVEPNLFLENLTKNIDKDIIYKNTSYGPHKDDIMFFINDINVKSYGSQGQQRTASLSTKLAEISLIKEEKGIFPILLLDDVLSELDESRQKFLIKNIKKLQVIITCTGIEDIIKKLDEKCNIFRISNGNIF